MTEQNLTRQAKLLQYANNKRIDGDFNNVTIQAGDESILANRMVLACYSKFFESMFLSPLKEKYQNSVEIKHFDGKAVKQVIEFIYTGNVDINANNVLTLLGTADFLQVDDVKKMCFDFMETLLTIDSCLDVVKASVLYNNPSLQQTFQYISDNFDEIAQGDSFKQLSKDELLSLFTNIDHNKVQEVSLYLAIVGWIEHDGNREAEFPKLFLTVHLEKFPSKYVANVIAKEPLVKESKECLNAVVSYYANREKDVKVSNLFCVGGDESKSVSEVHCVSGDLVNTYPDLPCVLSNHCALKVEDLVYCLGGAIDGNYMTSTNKVYRLNLKTPNSGWEKVASMAEKRSYFGAAVWNNNLVVTGGYNGTSELDITELYQPRLNRWSTIAPLNIKRDEHVLVAADERLFAIGGCDDGAKCLSSVEQLDGQFGRWREIKPMKAPRSYFAAVACNEFIYAIGGQNLNIASKSVEKYNLNEDQWTFVSDMNVERWKHAACVVNGRIFVVGGSDNQGNAIKTIECYDPVTNNWSVVGETEQKFNCHAVVAV